MTTPGSNFPRYERVSGNRASSGRTIQATQPVNNTNQRPAGTPGAELSNISYLRERSQRDLNRFRNTFAEIRNIWRDVETLQAAIQPNYRSRLFENNDEGIRTEERVGSMIMGLNANRERTAHNTRIMLEGEENAVRKRRKGLSGEVISAALTRDVYQPAKPGTEPPCCSICLEDVHAGELRGMLDCNHSYHYLCIKRWLQKDNSCPLCRNKGVAI